MIDLNLRNGRIKREKRTVEAMIELNCRDRHAPGHPPCEECAALLAYAWNRLDRCPWGERKPTCAKCPVHCYRPAERDQVRRVMRYAGPRMLLHRPMLAIAHLLDELRASDPAGPESPRGAER